MTVDNMKKYLSAIIMLVLLCGLAGAGRAKISGIETDIGIPTISPMGHEPLRAAVVNHKISRFTIDVQQFANIGVSEDAQTFAMYTRSTLPSSCGDFSARDVPYWSPSKYTRTFDLRGHPDVLKALDAYGCIILKNNQSPAQQDS